MSTSPFVVEGFKGLRLDVDPQDLGLDGAVDLLNVDFDRRGMVRTRDGSVKANGTTLSSNGYQALFPSPTNGGEILAVRGTAGTLNIDKMTPVGTTTNVGSFASTAFPLASTALGTPSVTNVYITFCDAGTTGVTIRKYDGTTLGTGTGKPLHVATWPTSSRLVQGGYFAAADSPSGANGDRSTVFFSDAGAPDTYTATSFVTLRPGDGEVITAIVSWRDLLFVFKQTSAFIFYGEETNSAGQPIFRYRRVDLPEPMLDPAAMLAHARFAVAGPDAVYYSTPLGIWRMDGQLPQQVSSPVAPMFGSGSTNVSSAVRTGVLPVSLHWVTGRLIGSYTSVAGSTRQIVWHVPTGQWTIWSHAGKSFVSFPAAGLGSSALRDFMYFPNGNDIWVAGPDGTTDNGSAIAWSYTSGMYSPANDRSRVAISLESQLIGSGTATLQVATTGGALSSSGALDTGSAVTMGTAPAIAEGWQQIDREGALWQHKLSGSGVAVVAGLTHYLSFVKPSGVW